LTDDRRIGGHVMRRTERLQGGGTWHWALVGINWGRVDSTAVVAAAGAAVIRYESAESTDQRKRVRGLWAGLVVEGQEGGGVSPGRPGPREQSVLAGGGAVAVPW